MKKFALLVCFGLLFGVSVMGCTTTPADNSKDNGKSAAVCAKCGKPKDKCTCKKGAEKCAKCGNPKDKCTCKKK